MKTSKKPSATNASPREPGAPKPVLFLDRAIESQVLADALQAAGARVELHRAHFRPDTEDTVWLSEVGRRGWFVLTRDQRIRYNPLEREAVKAAQVGVFVLALKNLTGPEIAVIVVTALPAIERTALRFPCPFIAKILRDGKVQRWT